MGYDGKIISRALQRFEEDRRLRDQRFLERRESVYARQPRLREIDGELRATMSRLISGALRRGTDPRPPAPSAGTRAIGAALCAAASEPTAPGSSSGS